MDAVPHELVLSTPQVTFHKPSAAFAAQSERHDDPEDDIGGHVPDANDDYLVAIARAAEVDAIVSLDRDLLDARLDGLVVTDPVRFLASL